MGLKDGTIMLICLTLPTTMKGVLHEFKKEAEHYTNLGWSLRGKKS